jgi:dihydrofolate synthase/folylpolyglutamate synthase
VIRSAAASVYWPGRCETLQERPLVLLDGAINAASARSFLAAARPLSRPTIVAISGVPADKDYHGVLRVLGHQADKLVVTSASNPYLHFPADALAAARQHDSQAEEAPTLAEAVERGLAQVGADGTLWIVGTQSLVADALRLWGRNLEEL